MPRRYLISLVFLTLCPTLVEFTRAATAFDSAADHAYDSGLANGSNGGTGFGPWTRVDSFGAGAFIGSSTANGGTGTSDTSGRSFGLNAAFSPTTSLSRTFLSRPFTQGALQAHQTFGLDIDAGSTNFQVVGLAQQSTPTGPYALGPNLAASSAFADYFVSDSGSDWFSSWHDTGIPASQAVHAMFTVNAGGTYNFNLNSLASSLSFSSNGSTQGLALNTFYTQVDADGNTVNSSGALYFNNIGIDVPEPSTLLLLPCVMALCGRTRRRRS